MLLRVDFVSPELHRIHRLSNSSACFLSNDRLIAALWNDAPTEQDFEDAKKLDETLPSWHCELRVFDLKEAKLLSTTTVDTVVGTIMPIDEEYIIGFYDHPKLISVRTGAVLQSWPHIPSGKQTSSIIWSAHIPPMAFDAKNRRFAVATDSEIVVVQRVSMNRFE